MRSWPDEKLDVFYGRLNSSYTEDDLPGTEEGEVFDLAEIHTDPNGNGVKS